MFIAKPSLKVEIVFSKLFGEVCKKFNISVPVLGSNNSGNGTTFVPSPFPSTEPFTGSANLIYDGQVTLQIVSTFALIVVVVVTVAWS